MKLSHALLGTVATAAILCGSATAGAQGFDVQQFNPGPSQSRNILNVSQAQILGGGQWELGLMLHYADSELVYQDSNGEYFDIVGGQLTANIMGAIGIADRLEVGIDIPLVLTQSGDAIIAAGIPTADEAGFGLGDIRFVPTLNFFNKNTESNPGGLALSLAVNTWLPTGDEGFFQGDGSVRVEPRLMLDIATTRQTIFSINAGYLIREEETIRNLEVDDTVTWGAGVDIPFGASNSLHWLTEFTGDISVASEDTAAEENPLSVNFGIRYHGQSGVLVQTGGGLGLIRGFGTPTWRAFLGLAYAKHIDCDPDDDGLGCDGTEDICPNQAEDADGFEDEDGCPDVDNDADGIRDRNDDCPMDPEDEDDFQDADGCPDPDNDDDGILDGDDQCPNDPEDMDGFQNADGCPDPDNDEDGILDVDDACPDIAEDMDGFEDEDGCIDFDNDRDGLLDGDDSCPNEAEDFDGYEDADGCPEEGTGIVQLTCDRIEIGDSVYFDTGSDQIQERSFELLDQVAGVLGAASYVRRIRVEGHTDDRGDDDYNLDLSQRRAASVLTYLLTAGIEAGRLESEGLGETIPIADNDSRDGRAENRRVEFYVVEQDSTCGEALLTNDGDVIAAPVAEDAEATPAE
jgi:outer membrane protein OmpA-like peptidoglycan-associated protein